MYYEEITAKCTRLEELEAWFKPMAFRMLSLYILPKGGKEMAGRRLDKNFSGPTWGWPKDHIKIDGAQVIYKHLDGTPDDYGNASFDFNIPIDLDLARQLVADHWYVKYQELGEDDKWHYAKLDDGRAIDSRLPGWDPVDTHHENGRYLIKVKIDFEPRSERAKASEVFMVTLDGDKHHTVKMSKALLDTYDDPERDNLLQSSKIEFCDIEIKPGWWEKEQLFTCKVDRVFFVIKKDEFGQRWLEEPEPMPIDEDDAE